MFLFIKKNISKSVLLVGLTIAGLLLLANGLMKAIFILSNESAVQKAEVSDIVLGTLSLGLTLLAMLLLSLVQTFVIKKHSFNHKLIFPSLLGAAALMFIASIMVVVKDHTSYTGDWAKLNDVNKARWDIGSNLAIVHTLVADKYGNPVLLFATKNSLSIDDYSKFLLSAISTKKDLAALYGIDELLNVAHEPLIAGTLVDAMAAAWQADNTVTAASWVSSASTLNPYDFVSVLQSIKGSPEVHHILAGMSDKPFVFTGITIAYLQGFPITIAAIALLGTTLASSVALSSIFKEEAVFKKPQTKAVAKGAK